MPSVAAYLLAQSGSLHAAICEPSDGSRWYDAGIHKLAKGVSSTGYLGSWAVSVLELGLGLSGSIVSGLVVKLLDFCSVSPVPNAAEEQVWSQFQHKFYSYKAHVAGSGTATGKLMQRVLALFPTPSQEELKAMATKGAGLADMAVSKLVLKLFLLWCQRQYDNLTCWSKRQHYKIVWYRAHAFALFRISLFALREDIFPRTQYGAQWLAFHVRAFLPYESFAAMTDWFADRFVTVMWAEEGGIKAQLSNAAYPEFPKLAETIGDQAALAKKVAVRVLDVTQLTKLPEHEMSFREKLVVQGLAWCQAQLAALAQRCDKITEEYWLSPLPPSAWAKQLDAYLNRYKELAAKSKKEWFEVLKEDLLKGKEALETHQKQLEDEAALQVRIVQKARGILPPETPSAPSTPSPATALDTKSIAAPLVHAQTLSALYTPPQVRTPTGSRVLVDRYFSPTKKVPRTPTPQSRVTSPHRRSSSAVSLTVNASAFGSPVNTSPPAKSGLAQGQ